MDLPTSYSRLTQYFSESDEIYVPALKLTGKVLEVGEKNIYIKWISPHYSKVLYSKAHVDDCIRSQVWTWSEHQEVL